MKDSRGRDSKLELQNYVPEPPCGFKRKPLNVNWLGSATTHLPFGHAAEVGPGFTITVTRLSHDT